MKNPAWQWRPIGELFDIGAGKTMSAAARDGAEPTPFLRTSNVFWDEIDLSKVDEMTLTPRDLAEKRLAPGDLLVCEGGEIGRAAVWDGQVETMSFQNHLHRLRPKIAGIDPLFYAYFLQSAFTQLGIFEGAGNKTTIPNLSSNRLAELDVPQPPLDEQVGIRRVLRFARQAMQENDLTLKTVDELKSTAMHQLFTSGLQGEAQKESEIGPVPESWTVRNLRGLFEIKHGLAFSGESFRQRGNFVLMTPGHFFEGGGFRDQGDKTKYVIGDFPSGYLLKKDDLVIAMTEQKSGLLGSAAFVPSDNKFLHNQRLGLVEKLDEGSLDTHFLYHLLALPHVRTELNKTASGSKVRHTSPTKILDVVVPIPAVEEQAEISAVLDAIDAKIEMHVRKRVILEELFGAMLQKLMTGEIHVGDLDLSTLQPSQEVVA